MFGSAVKCWSNRQVTVALSPGEAELCSATKAAAELLGLVSLLWMQEAVESRRIATKKVLGSSNPPDVLPKMKSLREVSELLAAVRLFFS